MNPCLTASEADRKVLQSLHVLLLWGDSLRDYKPKKGDYIIPGTVWHCMLWTIRDRDRMEKEVTKVNMKQVKAIDESMEMIPAEYRDGVWESVVNNKPYPKNAKRAVYSYWKRRFVYSVAVKLGYL